ncbi:hypothetical protein [Syntrophobotulus glycolicus]|uniref:hypothetical protein n=1 Tax=Syntrophobotulus glycolicus TaxID=51197 RepID=UPI00145FC58C|nr:hypothetical protein [Syntrophobotulus glycolicus]
MNSFLHLKQALTPADMKLETSPLKQKIKPEFGKIRLATISDNEKIKIYDN